MPLKKTTKQIGDTHELQAKTFLESKGYYFLTQNYRCGRNEIDLIFEFEKTLIFVEVKFRKNNKYGNPEDFVTEAKLNRIMEASQGYILENNWSGDIRYDVVAITPLEVLHFKDLS